MPFAESRNIAVLVMMVIRRIAIAKAMTAAAGAMVRWFDSMWRNPRLLVCRHSVLCGYRSRLTASWYRGGTAREHGLLVMIP
jgi:hypothetical protein